MPDTAAGIYHAWCERCHGADGTGRVDQPTIKTEPLDFTDCKIATTEPDADWELVITHGGPVAGLSSEMPAFGSALTPDRIRGLVTFLRGFCAESGWPSGNLNLPRALGVEKAFPENEVLLKPFVSHRSGEYWRAGMEAVYERRLGKRTEVEVGLPVESVGWTAGRQYGFGDVMLGGKYVLHTDAQSTRMITAGMEVRFPTGSITWGFGEGTAFFEPFVAAAVPWGRTVLQFDAKMEIPARYDPNERNRHFLYDAFIGRLSSDAPNAWMAGVTVNGEDRLLFLTPQVRLALTRTGALAAAIGVKVPIIDGLESQRTTVLGYLLWEYLDPVRARR